MIEKEYGTRIEIIFRATSAKKPSTDEWEKVTILFAENLTEKQCNLMIVPLRFYLQDFHCSEWFKKQYPLLMSPCSVMSEHIGKLVGTESCTSIKEIIHENLQIDSRG